MNEVVSIVSESFARALSIVDTIWIEYGVALLVFSIFYLMRRYLTRVLFAVLIKAFPRYEDEISENIYPAFINPIRFLIVVLGIYIALRCLTLTYLQEERLLTLFRSTLVLILTWGAYNLTGVYSSLFENMGRRMNINIDDVIIPFLSRFVRFVIIALAITVLAQEWGFDINGFIAGLGLGGLALALAAQETLSNIFGGLVIITEKPFAVGDWIQTSAVEGTVEDIGFRSTRVRTFAHALVTVPNAVLAKDAITNWTRMGKRRVTFKLGVTYTTPRDKLEKCVNNIRSMLGEHPDVHKDLIMVRFDAFGDSSLEIFLYFFTITTSWVDHLAVKENVNFRIMEVLADEGVEVAFPSRSLYFENPLDIRTDDPTFHKSGKGGEDRAIPNSPEGD